MRTIFRWPPLLLHDPQQQRRSSTTTTTIAALAHHHHQRPTSSNNPVVVYHTLNAAKRKLRRTNLALTLISLLILLQIFHPAIRQQQTHDKTAASSQEYRYSECSRSQPSPPFLQTLVKMNISTSTVHTYEFAGACYSFVDTGHATVIDNNTTVVKQPAFLAIGVLSNPSNPQPRAWCRKYWERYSSSSTTTADIPSIRFIVGRVKQGTNDYDYFPDSLVQEAMQYRDLIIIDAPDGDYQTSLPRKTVALVAWATTIHHARFFFKTDDDTYLHVPNLVQTLHRIPNIHYGGGSIHVNAPIRRTGSWAVNFNMQPSPYYPPYVSGEGYVLSSTACRCVLEEMRSSNHLDNETQYKTMGVEDAMIGMAIHNGPFRECRAIRPRLLVGSGGCSTQRSAWKWWAESLWRRLWSGQWNPWNFPVFLVHHVKTEPAWIQVSQPATQWKC